MFKKRSYQDILNIPENASKDLIKKSQKEHALKTHPDKINSQNVTDNDEFIFDQDAFLDIQLAYETLINEELRKKYDENIVNQSNNHLNQESKENNKQYRFQDLGKSSNKLSLIKRKSYEKIMTNFHHQDTPRNIIFQNEAKKFDSWNRQNSEKDLKSSNLVKKMLNCGHVSYVEVNSGKMQDALCKKLVVKKFPCGHQKLMPCFTNINEMKCQFELLVPLECGHDYPVFCQRKAGFMSAVMRNSNFIHCKNCNSTSIIKNKGKGMFKDQETSRNNENKLPKSKSNKGF